MKLKIDNWNKVSINLYYKIVDVIEEDLQPYEKNIKLISLLADVPEQEVWDLNFEEYQKLMAELNWLNTFDFSKKKAPNTISINGAKYDVQTDIMKMKTSAYIDFQTFWARNDLRTYYGNLLACFITPKGKTYGNEYDVTELANLILNELSIVTANEIFFSYLIKLRNLTVDTLTSLEEMMKDEEKIPKEMKEELLKNINTLHTLLGSR